MDLEDTLASLKLNDQMPAPEDTKEEKTRRRSSRLKTQITTYSEKRRVTTKPVKVSKDKNVAENADSYYLDKRIKRASPSLETIYEDKSEEDCMSSRKLKRAINFNTVLEKIKTKKRKMKAKSVSSHQRVKNKCRISLDYLLAKLEKVDE